MNEIFECGAPQSDHFAESGGADRDVLEFQKSHDGLSGRYAVSGADHFILRMFHRNSDSFVREVAK